MPLAKDLFVFGPTGWNSLPLSLSKSISLKSTSVDVCKSVLCVCRSAGVRVCVQTCEDVFVCVRTYAYTCMRVCLCNVGLGMVAGVLYVMMIFDDCCCHISMRMHLSCE